MGNRIGKGRKEAHSLEEFFVELNKRKEKGGFFYRINHLSEEISRFLYRYYGAAQKSGVIIEGRIENPIKGHLSYYEDIMGNDFQMKLEFISLSLAKWLPRMGANQRTNAAQSLYDSLKDMREAGKTETVLKNTYIKFMCWLYYKFERIVNQLGQENVPKILYCGSISSYELIFMSLISDAGCDVVLLQAAGDEEYLKLDPNSERSSVYQVFDGKDFPEDFSLQKFLQGMKEGKIKQNGKPPKGQESLLNCTNAWIEGKGISDFLQAPLTRGNKEGLFYNCYCRINGVEDRLTYVNELYQFYLSLENEKRPAVIVNGPIPRPSPEEIRKIRRKMKYEHLDQLLMDLQTNIQSANLQLKAILVKAFTEIIREEAEKTGSNINRLMNKAVYLLCWIHRYQDQLFRNWQAPQISCFIYMGGCRNADEAILMKYLARTPADVLILCPNLNVQCCLQDPLLYEINHQNSLALDKFPEPSPQLHIGTAAHHAERDLDSLMYNHSVIFREQQFSKAHTVSLRTMDREIKILWNVELKFRPNFSTAGQVVNLPVIFAKMSGIKNRDIRNYWISIRQLMTPDTLVIDRAPFISPAAPNPIRQHAASFFKNGKLLRNKIKNHPDYPYSFLREEMQEHILDKLELMIDQKLIRGTFENGTEYTVISVALNLPREAARLIQKFDFTKNNPKLIYVNTSERLISLEDSIYVTFLNLLGFDVLFFIPTGYNIEKYFNQRLMEEHQLGDYVYDLEVPDWEAIPMTASKSWRDKLFKRG